MGHGPDLKKKIGDSTENIAALNAAIKKEQENLNNTMQVGIDYINAHTEGILEDEQGKVVGILASKADAYTKFSESYSLDALTPIIDGAVDFAVDYFAGGEEGVNAAKLAGDTGKIVKGILSLFASSSTTTEKISTVFTQFRSGDDNYAIYYASNSGTVAGKNAWGNKELMVISNVYIFAQVKENKAITEAEIRQHILDNIKQAENVFGDKEVESITNPDLGNVLERAQKVIGDLKKRYDDEGGNN